MPLLLLAVAPAAACAGSAGAGAQNGGIEAAEVTAPENAAPDRPVVEVAATGQRAVQPAAVAEAGTALEGLGPRTPLGQLRARHLPVWTPDFDWAFPPEVCASAWELDAIAEPDPGADVLAMGDFATAAALTVMRYEHQFSRALAAPSPLAQLCVAVASVDPLRSENLNVLASYLDVGARRSQPAVYPAEVVLVGVSEAAVVAVACVVPGYSDVVGGRRSRASDRAGAGPAAGLPADGVKRHGGPGGRHLLPRVAGLPPARRGLLGSGRLGRGVGRPRAGLDRRGPDLGLDGRILTVDGICDSPPPQGPDECPRDWPS